MVEGSIQASTKCSGSMRGMRSWIWATLVEGMFPKYEEMQVAQRELQAANAGADRAQAECERLAKDAAAADAVEAWMFKMGVPEKLADMGYIDADVEKLVRLTRETPSLGGLLDLAPVEATPEVVGKICRDSLKPRK